MAAIAGMGLFTRPHPLETSCESERTFAGHTGAGASSCIAARGIAVYAECNQQNAVCTTSECESERTFT